MVIDTHRLIRDRGFWGLTLSVSRVLEGNAEDRSRMNFCFVLAAAGGAGGVGTVQGGKVRHLRAAVVETDVSRCWAGMHDEAEDMVIKNNR